MTRKLQAANQEFESSDAKSIKVTLIQIAVLAAALLVGFGFSNGYIGGLIPKPATTEPVIISMHGPTEIIVGKEFIFYIEISGSHGKPKWELIPDTPGAMTVSADGMKAHFNFDLPGFFSLTASVAGEGMSVDTKHIEFDSLLATTGGGDTPQPPVNPPLPVQPVPVQPAPCPQPTPMPTPSDTSGQVTVSSLVIAAIGNHQTDDANLSVVDAQKIGGCINALITKIANGLVDNSEDPVELLVPCIQQALGERADRWAVFLVELSGIFDELRQQGSVTDIASYQAYLREVAVALVKVRKDNFNPVPSFQKDAEHEEPRRLIPSGSKFGPKRT